MPGRATLAVILVAALAHGPDPATTTAAGAKLSQLLAQHGHPSGDLMQDDTHSALAALSRRKRKTPPPTDAASAPRPPTPNCEKALGSLCGEAKGNVINPDVAACQACTLSHKGTLSKDGCTARENKGYCLPPPLVCPTKLSAQVNATGLLPVDLFRTAADGSDVPCDVATRLAINMSKVCGGTIFFATACDFNSTVIVPGATSFQGGGDGGSGEFLFRPQSLISGPDHGPAFLVQHTTNVEFTNLEIAGHNTGVIVTDSALVRFRNVGIRADYQGLGDDDVNLTRAGCDGCNVVLGSNNTALVIENSFWVWAEDCSFFFYPLYRDAGASPDRHDGWGQRPSVIIRGNTPGHFGINTVYLLHFGRITMSGGGFQYQQLVAGDQWPGFYDFNWITTEVSATPLLDVQVGTLYYK